MFSSLISVLCYTKIIMTTQGRAGYSCELKKISDTELIFLTIKPIQKQSPRSVP